jgi:hypothetical protein
MGYAPVLTAGESVGTVASVNLYSAYRCMERVSVNTKSAMRKAPRNA